MTWTKSRRQMEEEGYHEDTIVAHELLTGGIAQLKEELYRVYYHDEEKRKKIEEELCKAEKELYYMEHPELW